MNWLSFRAKSRLQRSPESFRGEARLSIPWRHCVLVPLDPSTLLRSAQDDAAHRTRHFLTISAFSIMAMPPRSAILPFNVIVLPQ
jgi:hypothetical protein